MSGSFPRTSVPPCAPWSAGLVVGGRYRLVARLGAGSMGEVWRAEHVTLGTGVAVKLVDLEAKQDPEEVTQRFLQEARAVARLQSPHIVQILDHGIDGGIAYMAMELLEGESLAERLERKGKLPPDDVIKIVRELCVAVDKAHATQIVHRDLKPANLFFARVDGAEVLKVLDFGIAKVLDAQRGEGFVETRAGVVVGTPAYMSPEQVVGKPIGPRSDLWQIGVLVFECLCGTLPFHGTTLGDLFMNICSGRAPVPSKSAEVPAGFDGWFARAVQLEPEARFGSARELTAALEASLSFQPTGTLPAVEGVVFRKPPSARPLVWVGSGAGALLVGVVLVLSVRSSMRDASGVGEGAPGAAQAVSASAEAQPTSGAPASAEGPRSRQGLAEARPSESTWVPEPTKQEAPARAPSPPGPAAASPRPAASSQAGGAAPVAASSATAPPASSATAPGASSAAPPAALPLERVDKELAL
jgi:eukaryotic-like serine/threonine-protein kinase